METTERRKRALSKTSVIALVGLLLAAVALGVAFVPRAGVDRTIIMAAVEYKGTFGSSESQPEGTVVKAYRWDPSYIVVNQGDRVTLKIFGVNGAEHPTTIEGYGLTFTVTRGEWTTVTFTASKGGVFEMVCHVPEHTATMHAYFDVRG